MCARGGPDRPYAALGRPPVPEGVAVSLDPTKIIEQTFQLKRSTTVAGSARARQAGYLGRAGRGTRDSNGPHRQARRAPLSSGLGRPETVGSAPKNLHPSHGRRGQDHRALASKLDGSYVDHKNKITIAEYARDWACDPSAPLNHGKAGQVLIQVPIASTELGARKVSAARPSEVQARVTERSQTPSPGTVRLLVQAALSLQMLACKIVSWRAVRSPRISLSERIIPLSVMDLQALADAMPERCRAIAITQAGSWSPSRRVNGAPQQEVDFLRRTVRVAFQTTQAVSLPVRYRRGGADSTAVLVCAFRQSVGSLVDLFASLRYEVSDRVHTLLSRFHHVRQLSRLGVRAPQGHFRYIAEGRSWPIGCHSSL